MPQCSFKYCKNHTSRTLKKDGVSYFRFPRDPVRCGEWISVIARQRSEELFKPTPGSVVCSKHFLESDEYVTTKGIRRLLKTAVPQIEANDHDQDESSFDKKTIEQCCLQPQEDSDDEIKVFCPKCETEVTHTPEGIQEDQTKILVAKVYHYFEQEYEELKTIYGDLDLTPLSKFRQRTALATGVSETKVLEILKDEERRNADKRQEPPAKGRVARKRSRQPDSSSEEDCSDDIADADDNGESSHVDKAQTIVVKEEPTEYYNEEPEIFITAAVKDEPCDIEVKPEQAQTDPISVDVKTEPVSDVVHNPNETLALNEPAGTKRKGRKISRKSDVTSTRQHSQGESSTAAVARKDRLAEALLESGLLGDTEMKSEEIEIHEEGVS